MTYNLVNRFGFSHYLEVLYLVTVIIQGLSSYQNSVKSRSQKNGNVNNKKEQQLHMQLYLVMKLDVVLNHLNISHRNIYVMFCHAENVNTIASLIN